MEYNGRDLFANLFVCVENIHRINNGDINQYISENKTTTTKNVMKKRKLTQIIKFNLVY